MRILLLFAFSIFPLLAQQGNQKRLPGGVEILRNLDYVGDGNPRQMLDVALPKIRTKLPVIVFIHGGAWRGGSKDGAMRRLLPFVQSGHYIAATINYRLSGEAKWPAQIHDCKAAIRYLRGRSKEFGIDPDKIGVWGSSAGGHLVSMLGTSGGVAALEGNLGEFDDESSHVTCVVNYFGPSNLLSMITQKSTIDRSRDKPYPEALLLGGPVQDLKKAAKQASPVTWVTKDDPPFLTAHGSKDLVVPYQQGEEIHAALTAANVESVFIRMEGAGHGFKTPEIEQRVTAFFEKHLRNQDVTVSDKPILEKRNSPKPGTKKK